MNQSPPPATESIVVGVITVSDRASTGIYEDRGGPAIHQYLTDVLVSPWQAVTRVIADDQPLIERTIRELAAMPCRLIVTTGGTGPSARDVTPEATEAVCEKILPGFGEQMRRASLVHVPTAILSRQTAGICNGCLVINLPGQPKAIAECLDAIFAAVPYCIELIGGPIIETNPARCQAFRPKR